MIPAIAAVVTFVRATLAEPVSLFTFALVVSTVLLWLATLKLAREGREASRTQGEKMERSIAEAGNAAKAMERQNEIAEDTSKRQLRAYLCLQPVVIDPLDSVNEQIGLTLPVENTGETPANRLLVQWAWIVTSDQPTSELFESTLAKYPMEGDRDHSIGPRQLKSMPLKLPVGTEWRAKVIAGEAQFYFLGRITYVDAFGEERLTEFFYCYNPALPNRLGQVSVHNRID